MMFVLSFDSTISIKLFFDIFSIFPYRPAPNVPTLCAKILASVISNKSTNESAFPPLQTSCAVWTVIIFNPASLNFEVSVSSSKNSIPSSSKTF